MTAAGNTTAEMVRQLAMAMTGYEARVVVNSADYSFSLEFLGESNTLADIDVSQVRNMVEQIKPAHLAVHHQRPDLGGCGERAAHLAVV